MAAVQATQTTPFQGVNYLSRNAKSSQLHNPLNLDRITTNEDAYNRFLRDQSSWLVKPKWGSSRLHGDLPTMRPWTSVQLSHLDKNHLHFGGGSLSYGRVFPIEAKYNVTSLKRSNIRSTDELIPDGNKVNLGSSQISFPYPAERPHSSHILKLAMFPGHDSPDDTRNGRVALATSLTLPFTAASASADTVVVDKIKGSPYRREIVRVVPASERKPLQWHGQTFNQLVKNPGAPKQEIYPSPPTSVKPDFRDRHTSLTVSQKTANVLRNLQDSHAKSEYNRQYTEHGETDAIKLNYNNEKQLPKNKLYPASSPKESNMAPENESPYTTIYNADYSTKKLHSSSILRKSTSHESNSSRCKSSNKTVQFNDKVTISNGQHTSSGFVNDLNENANPPQSFCRRPETPWSPRDEIAVKRPTRPTTAFTGQHDSRNRGQVNLNKNEMALRPGTALTEGRRLSDQLLQIQNNYAKTVARRNFHRDFPENAPDIRKTPDTRITINERRHFIPEVGCNTYYFHG